MYLREAEYEGVDCVNLAQSGYPTSRQRFGPGTTLECNRYIKPLSII